MNSAASIASLAGPLNSNIDFLTATMFNNVFPLIGIWLSTSGLLSMRSQWIQGFGQINSGFVMNALLALGGSGMIAGVSPAQVLTGLHEMRPGQYASSSLSSMVQTVQSQVSNVSLSPTALWGQLSNITGSSRAPADFSTSRSQSCT